MSKEDLPKEIKNKLKEDIERLIALMRETVKEKFGIELQQEVRVIGEK